MKLLKNIIISFCIINLLNTIKGELSCEDEAHKLIKFKSTYTFYIDDCKFVNLRFEDHKARNLKVSIVFNGEVLETLDLKESDGLLADFSTPVVSFTNKMDKNCEAYEFNQSSIAQFAPNLGYFTLYRDHSKMAALVYSFRKPTDFSLEGNIGHYVLRHLPDSKYNFRYIFIKLLDAYQAFPHAAHEVGTEQKFDLAATHLDTIVVEMIVVLDSEESNRTPTEMIKRVLMYYNYIDMLYCNFKRPIILLKIQKIMISTLALGTPNSKYLTSSDINSFKNFFEQQKKQIGLSNHQIVSVMTERLVLLSNNPVKVTQAMILNKRKICETSDKPMIIFALTVDRQAGHGIWVSQIFSVFGTDHFDEDMKKECRNFTVNVQSDNLNLMTLWPSCVTREYSNYFKTNFCSRYAVKTDLETKINKI